MTRWTRAEVAWGLLWWAAAVASLDLFWRGQPGPGAVALIVAGGALAGFAAACMEGPCACGHSFGGHNERGCCTCACPRFRLRK